MFSCTLPPCSLTRKEHKIARERERKNTLKEGKNRYNIVKGLAEGVDGISFESVLKKRHYLRARNNYLILEPFDDSEDYSKWLKRVWFMFFVTKIFREKIKHELKLSRRNRYWKETGWAHWIRLLPNAWPSQYAAKIPVMSPSVLLIFHYHALSLKLKLKISHCYFVFFFLRGGCWHPSCPVSKKTRCQQLWKSKYDKWEYRFFDFVNYFQPAKAESIPWQLFERSYRRSSC